MKTLVRVDCLDLQHPGWSDWNKLVQAKLHEIEKAMQPGESHVVILEARHEHDGSCCEIGARLAAGDANSNKSSVRSGSQSVGAEYPVAPARMGQR